MVRIGLIAVIVAIGTVACSQGEEESQTPEPSAAIQTSQPDAAATEQPKGFDDLMVEIEGEVPGFAGMSVAGNTLQVRSTTRDIDMNALKTAIVSRFPELADHDIQIVDATFDFGQLSEWYPQVQAALYPAPGVLGHILMTDIDETHNRILIGVDSEDAVRAAEREIAKLGLPPGAVQVIVTQPVIPD
jgi:hypothetical protein